MATKPMKNIYIYIYTFKKNNLTAIMFYLKYEFYYEALNDQNEQMLDDIVCKKMVLHQYVF